jgi:hypothetical protein
MEAQTVAGDWRVRAITIMTNRYYLGGWCMAALIHFRH